MIIFLLSGKRKSGKDYIANLIQTLNPDIGIYRISQPLKIEYALKHNLDLKQLMSSSEYKETYRKDMVQYGEEKRKNDPSYFCEKVANSFKNTDQIAMNFIVDIRRHTDIDYFKNKYNDEKNHIVITLRIISDLATRESRGFAFNEEIDNGETECDLDDFEFDYVIENYSKDDDTSLEGQFLNIFEAVALDIDNTFEEIE